MVPSLQLFLNCHHQNLVDLAVAQLTIWWFNSDLNLLLCGQASVLVMTIDWLILYSNLRFLSKNLAYSLHQMLLSKICILPYEVQMHSEHRQVKIIEFNILSLQTSLACALCLSLQLCCQFYGDLKGLTLVGQQVSGVNGI